MQTLLTRLLLLISIVCLLLLAIQQFVPTFYTSLLGRIDPATNTYCIDRCGPKASMFSAVEEGTSYGGDGSTVTISEADPPTPWFRTGFDSSVTTPPYLLILCLVLLFCSWFLWHYLQWLRRPRLDASGHVLPPRFRIFLYETKDLPADTIRKQLVRFNEQLPFSLQRRTHETVTEWFERIAFPSPVDPLYFEVRYGKVPVISTHQLTFFVQAMEQYLKKCHVQSSIS
ncbi:hypothetical protein [Exiguobacterium sp.]|uniref:hypothetical protein n=1 Tax=Exiguobacterium sp. TaxID=44751 RepID=UPI0028B0D9E0|nr:hypothetical protein [Exiguobacterium sp.]